MLEDKIFEDDILEVEPEQDWLVAEAPSRDISSLLFEKIPNLSFSSGTL